MLQYRRKFKKSSLIFLSFHIRIQNVGSFSWFLLQNHPVQWIHNKHINSHWMWTFSSGENQQKSSPLALSRLQMLFSRLFILFLFQIFYFIYFFELCCNHNNWYRIQLKHIQDWPFFALILRSCCVKICPQTNVSNWVLC